jgi:integrase/recombinase XerD
MHRTGSAPPSLYSPARGRKYLNADERRRVLANVGALDIDKALFALTLAWTGARVSEVLALCAASFQIERGIVALTTLKQRQHRVREVPIPPELMLRLESRFTLADRQRDDDRRDGRLWLFSRTTAWRAIKEIMRLSGVAGCPACPRGLRHSFGIGALRAGVPLNLLQRWLGHARIASTAVYTAACGPEEIFFADLFWQSRES